MRINILRTRPELAGPQHMLVTRKRLLNPFLAEYTNANIKHRTYKLNHVNNLNVDLEPIRKIEKIVSCRMQIDFMSRKGVTPNIRSIICWPTTTFECTT